MSEPAPIQVREVYAPDLLRRINNGDDLFIVDMRQPWEYQAGHIPGAVSIFIQEIPARLAEIPKDKEVIFQCWHGNTSLQASAFLIDRGWDGNRVASLSGGMAGWVEAHGPESLVKD